MYLAPEIAKLKRVCLFILIGTYNLTGGFWSSWKTKHNFNSHFHISKNFIPFVVTYAFFILCFPFTSMSSWLVTCFVITTYTLRLLIKKCLCITELDYSLLPFWLCHRNRCQHYFWWLMENQGLITESGHNLESSTF